MSSRIQHKIALFLLLTLTGGLVQAGQTQNGQYETIFTEIINDQQVTASVGNLGSMNEVFRVEVSDGGGLLAVGTFETISGVGSFYHRDANTTMQSSFIGTSTAEGVEGYAEFTQGDLTGFFSDTAGFIHDPGDGGGGGGGGGTVIVQQGIKDPVFTPGDPAAESYFECVGAVASSVGATIFGAQHHQSNVRGFRAGQVARSVVRTSGVALGAVVIGGLAVSAGVCLPELNKMQ